MRRTGRFLKSAAKWLGILAAIYLGSTFLTELPFESRMGWFLGGLAMAIAYVDGSLKERIANLEYQVSELNRRLNGY